jgi:Lar family restriction alleviation protein
MSDLKPCPFCGSTNGEVQALDEYVKCNDCEAFEPWAFDRGETDAVELWNRRVDPIARLEAWRMEKPDLRTYVVSSPTATGGEWSVLLRPYILDVVLYRTFYGKTLDEAVNAALKGGHDAGE